VKLPEPLMFNGALGWICPRCHQANNDIDELLQQEVCEEPFQVEGNTIEGLGELNDPIVTFHCPSCGKKVTAEDVRHGLSRWLKQLKRTNPERYAEVLANHLKST
jgi:uncharacterized protein YlaI